MTKVFWVLHAIPRAMALGYPAGRKDLLCGKIFGSRNKWSEELWWGTCNDFCFTNMGEVILPLPSRFLFCTPKQTVSSAQQNPWKQKILKQPLSSRKQSWKVWLWWCVTWQISWKQHLGPMSSKIPELEILLSPQQAKHEQWKNPAFPASTQLLSSVSIPSHN